MKLSLLYLILCVAWCRAAVDLTLRPNATGSDVVEAAIAIIQEQCVFEDDAQMLRRWAKASSDDGLTLNGNFAGGIWQITPSQFFATKNIKMSLLTSIQNEYGIDWSAATYEDLSRPLYSALAARISITTVEKSLTMQAGLWSSFTGLPNSQYINSTNSISSICDAAADIVFLVDGSGSISFSSFAKIKDFMSDLVVHLNVASNKTRIGVVVFSNINRLQFNLNEYLNENDVVNAIRAISRPRGGTNTASGLDYVRNYMFAEERGGRDWAPDIVLTITDGVSSSFISTVTAAKRLISSGIKSFAIGVGSNLRMSELRAIASDRDCNYLTILKGFDEFSAVASQIEKRVCEVRTQASNGITNTISPGGTKFYYYILNSTCGLLEISILEGTAMVYYSTGYQPGPARYDYKEEVTTALIKKVLVNSPSQLYITVGAITQTTISFTSYDDQCACPENHVPRIMSSSFWDCQYSVSSIPISTIATTEIDEGVDNSVSGFDCALNSPTNPCIPTPVVPNKWYYPHSDPNKFVQCGIMTCHVMPCPPTLKWDDSILTCVR